jgi:hypothetical protein
VLRMVVTSIRITGWRTAHHTRRMGR